MRETLFNWLGQDLTGLTCLDLFAGSGALGFEAASRGASRVIMIERDREALAALHANRDLFGARCVEVVRADALEFLRGDRTQYDVIFVDPPFSCDLIGVLRPLLSARMAANARLYYESARRTDWPASWEVLRDGRAGHVFFQLIGRIEA